MYRFGWEASNIIGKKEGIVTIFNLHDSEIDEIYKPLLGENKLSYYRPKANQIVRVPNGFPRHITVFDEDLHLVSRFKRDDDVIAKKKQDKHKSPLIESRVSVNKHALNDK